mmetsp:Transcript_45272/g.96322  ORF Transcript_45272/g.96322 Transcript_45272/m.96322 type:complete len:212 (-) Transcript_45272:138-773(-)
MMRTRLVRLGRLATRSSTDFAAAAAAAMAAWLAVPKDRFVAGAGMSLTSSFLTVDTPRFLVWLISKPAIFWSSWWSEDDFVILIIEISVVSTVAAAVSVSAGGPCSVPSPGGSTSGTENQKTHPLTLGGSWRSLSPPSSWWWSSGWLATRSCRGNTPYSPPKLPISVATEYRPSPELVMRLCCSFRRRGGGSQPSESSVLSVFPSGVNSAG